MATQQEISAFLAKEFPQSKCVIESIGDCTSVVSHAVGFDGKTEVAEPTRSTNSM